MINHLVVKTVAGEEIIGELVKDTLVELILRRPRVLIMHDMGHGQMGASLVPFIIMGNDDQVSFEKATIACKIESIKPEYVQRYQEVTSGIQLARTLN